MWTEPIVTIVAATEPVTLTEAKAQCRVTHSSEDAKLNLYIAAARDLAEKYTGLNIVEHTVTFSRADLVTMMHLPIAPVQSLSVAYLDEANVSRTLASSVYDFSGADTLRPVLSLAQGQSWPGLYDDPEAVTVTAVTGFAVVPPAIRHGILLMVDMWFDGGDGMDRMPEAALALLENYRTFQ